MKTCSIRTADGHKISKENFPDHLLNSSRDAALAIDILPAMMPGGQAPNIKETVREVEVITILKVLESVKFNKSKAAEILKIDRKTLYNKLKGLNL